jgi:hypothetical protein
MKPASAPIRAWAPAAAIAAAIVSATIWVVPRAPRNPLAETAVWSLLLIVSFTGWGSLVRLAVAPRRRVDLGLRAVWGAGLLCFVGGALMVPALMVRTAALVLVEIGLGLALLSLARERLAVHDRLRFALRVVRREPALGALGAVVAGIVAVHALGAIADWHTNPYDDDIAYLAFVKKLSDTGTVIEPFSFRRLSAYGGQTLFLELASVRAAPSQAHTWDRCVSVLMIGLLVLGHRRRGRRVSLLFAGASMAMLVVMPSIAINTGSYFSGVLFFLGLYRTLTWVEDAAAEDRGPSRLRPLQAALPIALVSVAACTLRQNYLAVPVVVLGVSYVVRLWRTRGPLRARLVEPLAAAGLSLLFLVPWFIVSWKSCRTFLYPVMTGTFHPPLALNASAWNFVREMAFQSGVAIDGLPLEPLAMFFVAAALAREPGARMPLTATCLGAVAGFAALVHGLTQSDAQNIGRYAFAFVVAFVLAAVLAIGTAGSARKTGDRGQVAGAIALFAMLLQIALSREKLWKEYGLKFHDVELLAYAMPRVPETEPPERWLYARLQAAVPRGERIAVLVDEPYHLDFARNPIWNLDMPGYASLPPGMPSFKGSGALEAYWKGLGLRWVMWVAPEYSRYHYRRSYFLELFVSEQEIWRTYAPYLVDFIDNVSEIRKRHREAYAERGVVVIDLDAPAPATEAP